VSARVVFRSYTNQFTPKKFIPRSRKRTLQMVANGGALGPKPDRLMGSTASGDSALPGEARRRQESTNIVEKLGN
jgi:hypothetical protein